MNKYFISFATKRGFGNTTATLEHEMTEQDIITIESKIKEKFSLDEVIILNFAKLDNKNA